MSSAGPDQADIEAIVRRYLARLAMRYLPATALALALLLVIVLVPSRSPSSSGGQFGVASAGHPGGGAATPPGAGVAGTAPPTAQDGAAGVGGEGASAAHGDNAVSGPSGAFPATAAVGNSPEVAASTGGCGRGVREMPWSSYAPYCAPPFTGPNGGATAHGVTATTITMSFRVSDSGESAAVGAASGGGDPKAAQAEYLADLSTFVNYFNQKFQLYGRHVVVKTFTGQGDWIQEYQGQDQAGAQADAVTARDLGAFADVSTPLIGSTPTYDKELAQQHVISIGGAAASRAVEQQYAPYIYSVVPASEDYANFQAGVICERMVGLKAIFAGDPLIQAKSRVFGIVNAENPEITVAADQLQRHITGCGGTVGRRVQYPIDLPSEANSATNAVAQLHAAGVTTVICMCDTIFPTLLTHNADSQRYFPEWSSLYAQGDGFGQQRSQDQWDHSLSPGGTSIDARKTEAYTVYKLANPRGEPANVQADTALAYLTAMLLFDGLQAAGPNLTAATFAEGEFSLPASLPSATGATGLGPWQFGPNSYSPSSGQQLAWWNPSRMSPQNGSVGSYQVCGGRDGDYRPIQTFEPDAYGPVHQQLTGCFAK